MSNHFPCVAFGLGVTKWWPQKKNQFLGQSDKHYGHNLKFESASDPKTVTQYTSGG